MSETVSFDSTKKDWVSDITPTALLIDDNPVIMSAVKLLLRNKANLIWVSHPAAAINLLRTTHADIILLDLYYSIDSNSSSAQKGLKISDGPIGLEWIQKLKAESSHYELIVISAESNSLVIEQAIMLGADDYIQKDDLYKDLGIKVTQALKRKEHIQNQKRLHHSLTQEIKNKYPIIGSSDKTQKLIKSIQQASKRPLNVLLFGETGTGKELIARAIHANRSANELIPFVAIDSATIQHSTAESELFGYEKGAFTGADSRKIGLFEQAHGGIIYFDELANMPLDIQSKLLRAVQEKEIRRLGSNKVIKLDFTIISATNRDLQTMIQNGEFKADLYQRLCVFPIEIPSLKERKDDLLELIDFFSKQNTEDNIQWRSETLELLQSYDWPGNIRELNNCIQFAATLCEGKMIAPEHLPPQILRRIPVTVEVFEPQLSIQRPAHQTALKIDEIIRSKVGHYEKIKNIENFIIQNEYQHHTGSITSLAKKLGVNRSYLYDKLSSAGIKTTKTALDQQPFSNHHPLN